MSLKYGDTAKGFRAKSPEKLDKQINKWLQASPYHKTTKASAANKVITTKPPRWAALNL